MKRNNLMFGILCAILMLNIIFTQYMVHQYFFENYRNVIVFGALNIILFPVAILVYRKDQKAQRRES
ncbi:hypothetical protein CU633_13180 [Bacillus sp. V3-13]|uniref:hypothetical protein n=1 Tax=Bacillus sp. V3-13 TaxID=2053728 RepID=UPI000C78A958|nr:hypothetical protein [Bacillus sp. V3-13]PLR76854.1 hypothetical protein CU633_13180 [Bacillus sp. V3-13]